jgi:hypothetical protein
MLLSTKRNKTTDNKIFVIIAKEKMDVCASIVHYVKQSTF